MLLFSESYFEKYVVLPYHPYSKVSGISGFGYKRKGWCQIGVPGISVRGGVGCPGYKRRPGYPVPGISVDQGFLTQVYRKSCLHILNYTSKLLPAYITVSNM